MFHQIHEKDPLNRVFELVEYAYRYGIDDTILRQAKAAHDEIDNPAIPYEYIVAFVERNRNDVVNLSWNHLKKDYIKEYNKKSSSVVIKSEEDEIDLSGYLSFYDKHDFEEEFCSFTASDPDMFSSKIKHAPFGDVINRASCKKIFLLPKKLFC